MVYLKLYENFDWDFDEEEQPISYNNIVGKRLVGKLKILYWDSHNKKWNNSDHYYYDEIIDFKHASKCESDVEYYKQFKPIPDDCYVFALKGHWPWFKFEEKFIDNIVLNEDFNWDFDEEEFDNNTYGSYIGRKVKLKPDQYSNNDSNPMDITGEIFEILYNKDKYVFNSLSIDMAFRVKWNTGYENSYTPNNLVYL